ncbi:Clavaminate synthase-like protein [Aspergillus ibericus CBS 121593]|uniref:Clavaminate synthase-like protein n=1 Tax=Aspergillus ibericus CBS 121593 TaxID=1448316 RepID=A0A395GWR4_9EURO|nr:Clavaminate synthase-like protein [Aspergillus ibericus CBS 121593]RAK99976.1 Clavaminate synthase-like protein [Aspergillus ibericus CBS 121593]
MKPTSSQLQQVHLGVSASGYEPVTSYQGDPSIHTEEHERLQARILDLCESRLWYRGSHEASCPRPILITQQHQAQLQQLHRALTAAIVDIVTRWWTDADARFPQRMPLRREEEELLKWLDRHLPPDRANYAGCSGSWRPDFLVEGPGSESEPIETFRITEINARFSFNGFMYAAYGQEALRNLCDDPGLVPATDPVKILSGLLSLFQLNLPLHLLKNEEPGMDIHMFIDFAKRHLKMTPRLITPADLRLLPDSQAPGGYKLCCVVSDHEKASLRHGLSFITSEQGEKLEIFQVGLELHQHELFALDPDMLRQISLRCFNDIRTILLVHDKRMLGIIKQEIPLLVARQVLRPEDGEALRRGIADTIIPGSPELDELIGSSALSPTLRKEYLWKPIRGGKGAGIVFGDEIDPEEWLATLERLRCPQLDSTRTTYVIQRRIWPALYEVILTASGERGQYPLEHGIVKFSLQFLDHQSRYLETLIFSLCAHHGHGPPVAHSASRGWFWDVRPSPVTSSTPEYRARSETMQNFPWHTDCSYETAPPQYFALQVLQPDRHGGGTLSIMSIAQLAGLLSPATQAVLQQREYQITIPSEFVKHPHQTHVLESILGVHAGDKPPAIRFREDIIVPLSPRAAAAMSKLKQALHALENSPQSILRLTAADLPEGSIILLDNHRWLHARDDIKDPARHLRRVRWNSVPFPTAAGVAG